MSTPGRGRVNRPLSRRCVNCSLSLAPNFRRRQIEELDEPMLILLRSWVTPTLISSDDILCVECFVLLQNRTSTTSLSLVSPALGHLDICFACGMSIASRRTHRVSQDCPQRNILLRWTPAHHVLNLERVCRACWEAASRAIKSQAVDDVNRHTVESPPVIDNIADAVIPVPPPLQLPVPPPQVILPIKPRCINCWIAVPITQKYQYNATHMDREIISLLEEWIARQVIDEDYLCQECASLLILELNNSNEGNKGERRFGHVSVCVCCGISISRRSGRLSRPLNYGSAEWIYSANKISPLELSSDSVLCTECMVILQDRASTFIDENAIPLPVSGHRSLCFPCGKSILRTSRTHAVRSDRQERNILLRKVPLHLVSRLERVCNACWLAAYREVRRQQHDTNHPILSEAGASGELNIPVPPPLPQHTSQHSRQPSPARAKIPSAVYRRAANTMPSNARACNACWQKAHRQPPPPVESGSAISTASTDDVDIPQERNPFISGSSSVVEPPSSASTDIEIILREPVVGSTDIYDDGDYAEYPDDDSDTLVESNVCRVCLAMDVKMYNLKDIELREMFQNITGIMVTENNHSILERLCWECAGRLKAAAAFRNKALLSDALLQGLASTGEQIRKSDITLVKENKDYLKLARTLSVVEVFHSVDIDPENDGIPPLSENNDMEIVQNTVREDSFELKKESIFEKDDDQTDVEDESMIEDPIKTEMEYDQFDHICPPNTGEESSNAFIERNPLVSNYVTLGDDKINSTDSSPLPGCSHVEPKYPIFGYLKKTPSDCENKIKKHVIITTTRDSISKIVSKDLKELSAKSKNINVKMGGVSKKTSNKKLVKKTEVKANTLTDEEMLSLEDFDF